MQGAVVKRTRAGAGRATRGPAVWSAAEAAALLGVDVARVETACRLAVAAGGASVFFGAYEAGAEGWRIPDRVMRQAAREWPMQHYSVRRVAVLAEVSERQIRQRLRVVPGTVAMEQGRREWELGARLFFGTQVRVPEAELNRLLAGRITAPPR